MNILRNIEEIRDFRASQLRSPLGFVPTMGNLHEGHLSLVRLAGRENRTVVVSVYVNPTQFNDPEDLASYPRTWEKDRMLLESLEVDSVFLPTDEVMYPKGYSITINPGAVAARWEGEHRPGHFEGVCSVVSKLLDIVQPDVAYFGEKDYQQLQVIRAMVGDLNLPVTIRCGPTIRETDGLALSSRNSLLSPDERARAPRLKQALDRLRAAIGADQDAAAALSEERSTLAAAGFQVDYLALVDGASLEPLTAPEEGARLLVAASIGVVRLIDNCAL
ncbi:MAG: pantoate--beta-alanine ligase [Fidelibacterota bacterium]|nr:MAG: pantoate--beta-alanine ligase [Candidatus Neomarinimicrobiota bacterium]